MTWRKNVAQQRVSSVISIPAPLGGINDVDPLAAMAAEFCIQCINWVPGNAALQSRQGYREWATNLGGIVKTIMSYHAMDGTYKIFATTDAGIYDVTVSSSAPPLFANPGNGRYNHVMFGNVGFQYLVAVSSGGAPSVFFDGTSWKPLVESATPVNPGEIKGVDPDVFSSVTSFKRRLWFVQGDSMTAWYLPVDALGGEAKPFYLSGIFKRGGALLYMIDWSVDAGDGLDDKLIFVSTLGEVAVYAGTDPDVTELWGLEAVFYMSAPIGDKSYAEFGGDVLMLSNYGLIPLTKVLIGRLLEAPMESSLTKKISRTVNQLINRREYARNWELFNLPSYQAVLIIVPPVGELPAIQFVMNSLTGAWTRFDLPVFCGGNVSGMFYFGTADGRVCLYGENNFLDDVKLDSTGGVPVICSFFSAYNYMGDPTSIKHWKLVRPIFQTDQPPSYRLTINTDYDIASLPGNPAPPADPQTNPLWDVAIWDNSFWSSALTVYRPWVGVAGIGFCCALLMKIASNDRVSMAAVEYVYEKGGAI